MAKTKKKEWYGIRSFGNQGENKFRVTKFDEDFEPQPESSYVLTVYPHNGGMLCTCPGAFHHGGCRHSKMMPIFIKNQAIDSGAFYEYNTGEWSNPIDLSNLNEEVGANPNGQV